ncbi:MAG: VWA domain-containing protein, partial [Polyangiales bacterium]
GFGGPQGGDFGATQGGIQDMSFARDTVKAGRVPPPEAFVVEAMFSEHDLPLDGDACETTLCLRAAAGVAPSRDDEPSAWVQVGMSSTVDPDTFERPTLSVVAVVDVSGSMGWSYGDAGAPAGLTEALLQQVTERLGENDRFAIVTYGSAARVLLSPVSAAERATVARAIGSLGEGGSTNMEAGLRLGYEVAGDESERAEQVRLMLFTDVQPNVGSTTATEFEQLVEQGAEGGAGLTVFAVGLGLNPDVLRGMSQIRDANAFSLTQPDDVPALMEDSWPWMVSPIAHDLVLQAVPSEGFVVAEGFGFPQSTLEDANLSVSTVFLSRRRGALLLRIGAESAAAFDSLSVQVSLSYQTTSGESREGTFTKGFAAFTESVDFEQAGVYKTVALARLVAAMKEAAEAYANDQDAAVMILLRAHEQFEGALVGVEDPALERERSFSAELLRLMGEGASQESFYGGF